MLFTDSSSTVPCAASLLPTFLPKPGPVPRKRPVFASLCSCIFPLTQLRGRLPRPASVRKGLFWLRLSGVQSSQGGHSTAGQFTSWWPESEERPEGRGCHKQHTSKDPSTSWLISQCFWNLSRVPAAGTKEMFLTVLRSDPQIRSRL